MSLRTRPLRTHREVVVESTRSIASITLSHCFPSLFRSSFSYLRWILVSNERERQSLRPEHERSTRIKKPQTALVLFTKKKEGERERERERERIGSIWLGRLAGYQLASACPSSIHVEERVCEGIWLRRRVTFPCCTRS